MVRRLLKILQQMMQDFYSVLDRFGLLYPSKHSSWWRRTEDVLSVTFFCFQRRLEYILRTSSRHNFKASSWRRLQEDVLEDVLKMSWNYVLKASWRHLEDVLQRRLEDVFGRRIANTPWRRLEDDKLLRWRRLQDVLQTSWKIQNVYWDIERLTLLKNGLQSWTKH